ncbi:MAG: PaaI family thioesterase [Planctomycetota bacterium]
MRSPVNEHLGIETIDHEDGSVELRLATGPEHRNEVDLVHGGIVSFLLDGAMGRAVGLGLGNGGLCATVQLSVQFLAPARGTIVAVGRATKRGRRVAFAEGECRREADGEVVARAHGTWAVR